MLQSVILRRLEVIATDIIGGYQRGFMRGKSTTDHIFTISQIMEKYYEYGQNVYIVFVDFNQTYDSVNKQQLWTALRNFGLHEKLVRMIDI